MGKFISKYIFNKICSIFKNLVIRKILAGILNLKYFFINMCQKKFIKTYLTWFLGNGGMLCICQWDSNAMIQKAKDSKWSMYSLQQLTDVIKIRQAPNLHNFRKIVNRFNRYYQRSAINRKFTKVYNH